MGDHVASGNNGDDWCLIESDPAVFTELLEKLGCEGMEVEELYSLDDASLAALPHVYGLVFLFKWEKENGESAGSRDTDSAPSSWSMVKTALTEEETPPDLFFAHQVTTNACATQAILSIVMNARTTDDTRSSSSSTNNNSSAHPKLGPILSEFKSFTQSFPPSLKGISIASSEDIRKVHNSFATPDAFLNDGGVYLPTGKEEAFHFVAYVPFDNKVYELDGLQPGPIEITPSEEEEESASRNNTNETDDDDWLRIASLSIQERMIHGQHVKFNLLAVIQDKRLGLQEELDKGPTEEYRLILESQLQEENEKRQKWKEENERRKHNFVPLCIQLLKELARAGSLPELTREAQERKRRRRNAQNE